MDYISYIFHIIAFSYNPQYNRLWSVIINYNGFFREVSHEIYKFFQSYGISCLVQLLY